MSAVSDLQKHRAKSWTYNLEATIPISVIDLKLVTFHLGWTRFLAFFGNFHFFEPHSFAARFYFGKKTLEVMIKTRKNQYLFIVFRKASFNYFFPLKILWFYFFCRRRLQISFHAKKNEKSTRFFSLLERFDWNLLLSNWIVPIVGGGEMEPGTEEVGRALILWARAFRVKPGLSLSLTKLACEPTPAHSGPFS